MTNKLVLYLVLIYLIVQPRRTPVRDRYAGLRQLSRT